MAVNTWVGGDSGNETDYGTAANWNTTGETNRVPTDADDVIIANVSDDCVLDGTRSVKSFKIEAGGDFNGNTETLTVVGEADGTGATTDGYAVDIDGDIIGTTTNITITTPAATNVDLVPSSGTIRHLTINHASCVVNLRAAHTTLSGNLTITAGQLSTYNSGSNINLTVAGHVSVTGDLLCYASTVIMGSCIVNSGGELTAPTSSGSFTINSESSSHAFRVSGGGTFNNSDGTLTITTPAETRIKMNGTGNLHSLTVNHASCVVFIHTDSAGITVEGDLTITAGTLNTSEQGGSDKNLTVTGDCVVTGTLTLNDSTVAVGALRAVSGAAITQGSSGTLEITTGSTNFGDASNYSFKNDDATSDINLGGTLTITAGTYFYPRTVPDDASVINNLVWNSGGGYWVGNLTIGGTLVVNASKEMNPYGGSKDIVVNGDVTLNGKLSAYPNGHSDLDTMTFGGIKIASGGEYSATTGTTEVTNRFTGTSNVWKNDGGTFTHNNGTVKFTDNDHSLIKELTFYNLEQASSFGDYTLSWETGGGGSCTVLNNLTITRGDFEIHAAGDTLDIHGQTILNGSSDTGARFNNDKNQTGTITHHGIVTINGGTYHVEDGATVNMAGIRNLGGVVD